MKSLKTSQLQPLAGYVLVEPAAAETKTASGIILPESDGEKPQYGTVLAVGEGSDKGGCYGGGCGGCGDGCCGDSVGKKSYCESPVQVGQTVVYKEWGGNKVMIDDQEYQFLKFEDILAIVSNKKSSK